MILLVKHIQSPLILEATYLNLDKNIIKLCLQRFTYSHFEVNHSYIDLFTKYQNWKKCCLVFIQAPFVGKYYLNVMDQGSIISAVPAGASPTNQVL